MNHNPGPRYLFSHPVVAIFMAIAGCCMLAGCDSRDLPAYSQFVDIDPEGWGPGNPAELMPWPRDSVRGSEPFSITMAVRYTASAPDTIPLEVTTEALDLTMRSDILHIPLRHAPGRPSGTGSFGVYTVNVPLQATPARLPDGLRIAISPTVPVRGLVSVGIILSEPTR